MKAKATTTTLPSMKSSVLSISSSIMPAMITPAKTSFAISTMNFPNSYINTRSLFLSSAVVL